MAPVSLLFWIVQVGVRTSVHTVTFQLTCVPVDPARPRVIMGFVDTLGKKLKSY